MRSNRRNGLTLLEVIFAMVVILVGMVSVGILIPLAGRQAADSYQTTQGLASGESALAVFNSTNIVQPSVESPWCLIDDVGVTEHSLGSMQQAYDRIAETFPAPNDSVMAAVAQNEAAGIGFCIDPLFWGYQPRNGNTMPTPFYRTRFPCLEDTSNPVTFASGGNRAPRLLRGSLTDPQASTPGSWLRQPAAIRLATMYGGDLVQPSTGKNKAIGPLRSVYVSGDTGNPIVSSPTSPQQTSWLMTVTPSDSTPITPLNRTLENWDGGNGSGSIKANRPVQIPRVFDVALVVFSKRDVREVFSIMSLGGGNFMNLPTGERALKVTDISSDALTSGTFNVTVTAHPNVDAKIKIGDWMMMSRFTKQELLPRQLDQSKATLISRQVHRWYRVVGVTGEDTFPRLIRVSGKPWAWSEGEIDDLKQRNLALPSVPPPPGLIETQAVLLKDVVHVYERQVELR